MSNRSFISIVVTLLLVAVFAYVLGSRAEVPSLVQEEQVSTTPQVTILPYGEVTLGVGQTATFPDLTMTLVRVFDDSRCPKGVTCIWAGTIKAEVMVVSGLGTSTSVIEMGKTLTTEAEEIAFVSAEPYPQEGGSIDGEAYRLVFDVTQKPR